MKAMQAILTGLIFAMGLTLLFDGGTWQQPVGTALVTAAVAEVTWVLYAIAEALNVLRSR